jgi:hypothetical protein
METAIASLLAHPTLPEAAADCGIAYSTLRRWLAIPEFDQAYRKARARILEVATAELRRRCLECVHILYRIAKNQKTPPAVRVSAASKILDSALRASELEDVQSRIEELERRLGRKL